MINWIIDFLTDRFQRIRLVNNCYSEWGMVPSGVPQGTKLGAWLFILMINDFDNENHGIWKFVDDTTTSEIVHKGAGPSFPGYLGKTLVSAGHVPRPKLIARWGVVKVSNYKQLKT